IARRTRLLLTDDVARAADVETDGMSTTAAKELLEVRSPVSGLSIEHLGITPASQIPDVVARAREAQPDWEGLGLAARARLFKRAQKWLTDNQARVVETI